MNPTNIDWPGLTHTWNPGYGCKRKCPWKCYARDLHNKRREALLNGKRVPKQYAKPFDELQFFPERLNIPKKSSIIKKVFVGSMTDICYWEPWWIQKVLDVIQARPEIEFMFLTKAPVVYSNWDFPQNCWLGTTVTGRAGEQRNNLIGSLYELRNKSFLSLEPLLGDFTGHEFTDIDLVIVGAMTGPGAVVPKKEWIQSIKHPNLHFKENIKKYL